MMTVPLTEWTRALGKRIQEVTGLKPEMIPVEGGMTLTPDPYVGQWRLDIAVMLTDDQALQLLTVRRPDPADEVFLLSDPKPHSRACGITVHDHGVQCAPNCPTCGVPKVQGMHA